VTLGAAAPLFMAAYLTSVVGGFAPVKDSPVSAAAGGGPSSAGRRRSRRRSARLKQFTTDGWSPFTGGGLNGGSATEMLTYGNLVAFCGSSLEGIGSCMSFEACPEYHKQPQIFGDGMAGIFGESMFFGDGMGSLRSSKSLRAARRHGSSRTRAGEI
jgi:hypothetical protein